MGSGDATYPGTGGDALQKREPAHARAGDGPAVPPDRGRENKLALCHLSRDTAATDSQILSWERSTPRCCTPGTLHGLSPGDRSCQHVEPRTAPESGYRHLR